MSEYFATVRRKRVHADDANLALEPQFELRRGRAHNDDGGLSGEVLRAEEDREGLAGDGEEVAVVVAVL